MDEVLGHDFAIPAQRSPARRTRRCLDFGCRFADSAGKETMAVILSRVINLRGPFFPRSFLPASLPGAWEQLVSFQLLGIGSCQEIQPFSPRPAARACLGFIRSCRGLAHALPWHPDRRGQLLPASVCGLLLSCSRSWSTLSATPVLSQLLGFLQHS